MTENSKHAEPESCAVSIQMSEQLVSAQQDTDLALPGELRDGQPGALALQPPTRTVHPGPSAHEEIVVLSISPGAPQYPTYHTAAIQVVRRKYF